MDAYINCLLSICCPPAQRQDVFVKLLTEKGMDAEQAKLAASIVLDTFDLAPKNTMQALIQEVARLARGADYKE